MKGKKSKLRSKVEGFVKHIERIYGFVKYIERIYRFVKHIKYLWLVAVLVGGPLLSTCTPSKPRELPISSPQIIWCNGALESSLLAQGAKRRQMHKREIRDGNNFSSLFII
jgi:hypothetical protein